MATTFILGGQWGDEGKGKIVDYLSQKISPDMGVRWNGGNNAGHSISNERGNFVVHLIPSTILTPGTLSVLANGVVIDPQVLLEEMKTLNEKGVDTSALRISERCHLIMPWHKLKEEADESSRGDKKLGTTGRGIGPCYADKVARDGFRVVDLKSINSSWVLDDLYRRKQNSLSPKIAERLPSLFELKETLRVFYEKIRDQIVDSEHLIWDAQSRGKKILMEGAQGTGLDIEFGTYPMVTSSGTTRLDVYKGAGVPPRNDDVAIGVFKGYVTRVGAGSFPTELHDAEGEMMREIGREYGATTNRPRRCGWFDAVQARHAQRLNNFNWIVLTKNDVLDTFRKVKICVAYELDGVRIETPPSTETELERCRPLYEEMPGWDTQTSHLREYYTLPRPLQNYCSRLQQLVGVPIGMISIGPKREETIEVIPTF